MIIQVVHLEVQPDKMDAFLEEARLITAESRKEVGVVQFDLLKNESEPNKFMLYEVYKSKQALEAHRLTGHFIRWVDKGVPNLTGERIRVIYTPVP